MSGGAAQLLEGTCRTVKKVDVEVSLHSEERRNPYKRSSLAQLHKQLTVGSI